MLGGGLVDKGWEVSVNRQRGCLMLLETVPLGAYLADIVRIPTIRRLN